jgi:type VI secretion system protein ImpJ
MTYVSLPDNAVIEARSFENAWKDDGQPLNLYIGLRKWDDSGENVTVLSQLSDLTEVHTRFVTTEDPEEVEDLYHTGPSAQVKRLSYVLKLFWETEKGHLGDYLLLPLARLERRGENVNLSETFIHPCLTIKSSQLLHRLITDIRDQVASRGRQLESYKRERGIQTAEFGSRDMVYILALRSLNRYIPYLDHILTSGNVHPWDAYGVLRQMIGELSAFSEQVDVMGEIVQTEQGPLEYDHNDLWKCYSEAKSTVTLLLDEITAGPEHAISLHYDGTYYSAELPPALFEGGNRYYLLFETEADPGSVLQSLQSISKLSSRQSLPILIARSLPGAGIIPLDSPPQELPRKARAIYCQIEHHHEQWDQIQKDKNIAIYWDTAPEDLKVELMVVGRK